MDILGVGTEIVECLRIGRMIERHGERFLTRVYTDAELRYCQARKRSRELFAERWAAKEAALKAIGINWHRGLSWTDLEVRSGADDRPELALVGTVREAAAARRLAGLLLSMSHCRAYAVAHVLALRGPGGAP